MSMIGDIVDGLVDTVKRPFAREKDEPTMGIPLDPDRFLKEQIDSLDKSNPDLANRLREAVCGDDSIGKKLVWDEHGNIIEVASATDAEMGN